MIICETFLILQAHLAAEKENAKWKRKSMDLEKQVLELEVERDKGKARAALSGKVGCLCFVGDMWFVGVIYCLKFINVELWHLK